jgi:hypothetical protein
MLSGFVSQSGGGLVSDHSLIMPFFMVLTSASPLPPIEVEERIAAYKLCIPWCLDEHLLQYLQVGCLQ